LVGNTDPPLPPETEVKLALLLLFDRNAGGQSLEFALAGREELLLRLKSEPEPEPTWGERKKGTA
jgi:hypothetical protein